ncbi:MAG TPA: hypothetical protein PLK69_02390 [Tetrasphaera sp.]|nr:hypothetical protein [Tetrasphaera sp.]
MEPGQRWERLFADLDAAVAADERRELDVEIADRTRAERAKVALAARLAAQRGAELDVRLLAGVRVHGALLDVGADWMLVTPAVGRVALVPLAAVVSMAGLAPRSAPEGVARRFGLGYALREISRDRARVQVLDVAGTSSDGTIDVVGADFLDLSEHPRDEARRSGSVRSVRTLPFAAIACIQSG